MTRDIDIHGLRAVINNLAHGQKPRNYKIKMLETRKSRGIQMTYRNEQNIKKFVTHINVEDSPSEQDNSSYRYQPHLSYVIPVLLYWGHE